MKMSTAETPPTLRPLSSDLGHLTRPDGSATLFQGDTSVMVSVYGPGEVKIHRENIDKATVDVVYKPKSGLPGCSEKSSEEVLRNTCETALLAALHPRSAVNITVQEIQNSGAYLAACVNCCCLALLDSSISMKCTMAAVSCCIKGDGQVVLDPKLKDEESCTSSYTFVFDSDNKDVITVIANGKYTLQEFQQSLVLCREASASVFTYYRDCIEKKLSKTV